MIDRLWAVVVLWLFGPWFCAVCGEPDGPHEHFPFRSEDMQQVINGTGVIVILAACASLLVAALGYFFNALDRYHEGRDELVRDLARRELGRLLVNQAHWLSENVPAMNAVDVIGRELADTGNVDLFNARDKWRRTLDAFDAAAATERSEL